jgi:fatty-acyl-CoA synthase
MPASRTVPALLDELTVRHPDLEFVVGGGLRYSYAALRDAARRFARGLHALGVRRGDKVAILMGNRPEWLVADFGILALGAIMVSINTWTSRRELGYMLSHSDSRVLVCTDRFLGKDYLGMLAELGDLGGLRHVIRVDPDARSLAGSLTWDETLELAASVPESVANEAQREVDPQDVAYLLYTSGSTSTPKGVQLQHYALIENMWWIGERQHLRVGDRLWLAVSLFWGLGCENALLALMTHGGTIVLQESFDAGEAIALIERERCSVIYATPNMVRAIAEHPHCDPQRLRSLRTGATIGTPEQIHLLAELGATEICNIYGLTETYGNCAVTDASLPLQVRATCVGEPLENVELAIVDPQTREPLPPGAVGEIKVRGYVTCGYYADEDKTREAFDEQGYFLTGDLGYLDEHGRLHFRGRLKEMIKTGGINVAPVEVEEVLMAHPEVEQAFVVGVADDARDEIVAAVVVPRETAAVDEETLRAHCAAELAAFKRPRRYLLLAAQELPLTSTGKVRKLAMPALFEV